MHLAKAVANAAAALVLKAKNVAQRTEDSAHQNRVIAAATQCALSTSQLVACTRVSENTSNECACYLKFEYFKSISSVPSLNDNHDDDDCDSL